MVWFSRGGCGDPECEDCKTEWGRMVTEKKSRETYQQKIHRMLKEHNQQHPIVETQWAVEEVTPAYNTGGYYDEDIKESSQIVSPKYDTQEDAESWMERHEADRGKYLTLVKLVGREYRVIYWTQFRVIKE